MEPTDDQKLLALAAKAAGTPLVNGCWYFPVEGVILEGRDPRLPTWNPLKDDGDALRLAVKLNLSLQSYPTWDRAQAWHPSNPEGVTAEQPHDGDPCAATRRAIVRAAAAIGAGK